MMDWALIPGQGIADLRLGYRKDQVRRRFGEPRVFRRTPDAPETDQFPADGIMVTYDSNGQVAFIEFANPANPAIQDIPLMGKMVDDILTQLGSAGVEAQRDSDGATIPSWRVGLYAPSGIIEGVAIGE